MPAVAMLIQVQVWFKALAKGIVPPRRAAARQARDLSGDVHHLGRSQCSYERLSLHYIRCVVGCGMYMVLLHTLPLNWPYLSTLRISALVPCAGTPRPLAGRPRSPDDATCCTSLPRCPPHSHLAPGPRGPVHVTVAPSPSSQIRPRDGRALITQMGLVRLVAVEEEAGQEGPRFLF